MRCKLPVILKCLEDENRCGRDFWSWCSGSRRKVLFSPDRAMTRQELNLPPRFEEAMKRRLGKSGIFVEVNGKYYLSEELL